MFIARIRIGDRVVIDGVIRLCVIGIDKGQIKFRIEAPREIPIARKEVMEYFMPRRQ